MLDNLCSKCGVAPRRPGRGVKYCDPCALLTLCTKCGLHPRASATYVWCRACGNAQQTVYRNRCINSGFCVDCGVTPHREGRRTCADCEAKKVPYRKVRLNAFKLKVVEYKGGVCLDCKLSFDCLDVYDFHHRDPLVKDFVIGNSISKPWDELRPELDKCDLLCTNCHRIRHATHGGRHVRKN